MIIALEFYPDPAGHQRWPNTIVRFLSQDEAEADEDREVARREYRNARYLLALRPKEARYYTAGYLTMSRGCVADPIGSEGFKIAEAARTY